VVTAFSALYGGAAQLRRAWYERVPGRARALAQPVISVGNLVVGGSGKTPVVAAIARLLVERGERPSILSRGYGRTRGADGVVVVSTPDTVIEPVSRSGDEPQMLARGLPGVPVIVSSDRYLAGALAERRFGCSVHILDDGYQHLQLRRDIDLLLVCKSDLDERLLPSGRLREPLAAAAAADALLVTGDDDDVEEVVSSLGKTVAFLVVPQFGEARPVHASGDAAVGSRRALAVAGIARPQRFFAAARAEGWDVVREMAFRDHHWFDRRDIDRIRAAAAETGADVVLTTEKDAMRLIDDRGPQASALHGPDSAPPWMYLPMHVVIESATAFRAWLGDRLNAARTFAVRGS
jgi:tetraacyldisaccharide 4'-kinase